MVPNDLTVLDAAGFHRPELMYEPFVRWLDQVFVVAELTPTITDDGRDEQSGNPTGSAGKHSLHRRGRAVDLRSRDWTPVQKWRVVSAIMYAANEAPGCVELEMVYSGTDRHLHVGVDETATTHRLIEADE